MLMNESEMKKIIKGLKRVKIASTSTYGGKNFYDVRKYSGRLGVGYTVSHLGTTETYIAFENVISRKVMSGDYDVSEAVAVAEAVKVIDFCGVLIAPTWELEMDTISGEVKFHRCEKLGASTISGRTLRIYWVGSISEKTLRRKIKRRIYIEYRCGNVEEIE